MQFFHRWTKAHSEIWERGNSLKHWAIILQMTVHSSFHKFWKNRLLFISGTSAMCLIGVSPLKESVSIGILGLLLLTIGCAIGERKKDYKFDNYVVCFLAAIIDTILIVRFISVWSPSSRLKALADKFHLSAIPFLTILGLLGGVLAFNFMCYAFTYLNSDNCPHLNIKFILNIIKNVDKRYKYTLVSALCVGIISQGMGLFNKFSFHDDVMSFGVGATYTSGRWMREIYGKLEALFYGDGNYSLPLFNGLLSILLIAVTACLMIYLLNIRSTVSCSIISGIMVSFPTVTGFFGYMYVAHVNMFALFFGILGAVLICKSKKWYGNLAGIFLVAASIGIYQAFLPIVLTAVLFYLMKCVLEEDAKKLIHKIVSSGISCILSVILYFIATTISLLIYDAELTSYAGINTMGKSSLDEYAARIILAYKEFFVPWRSKVTYPGNVEYIYFIIIASCCILCVIAFFSLLKENKLNALIWGCLCVLIPLCVNFIYVMADSSAIYSLTMYAQLMPFAFVLWIVEKKFPTMESFVKNISAICTVVLALAIVMYSRFDNTCYLTATYAQQEAISYFTTLVTQIKEADGYTDELPVVFINGENKSDSSLQFGDFGHLQHTSDIAPYCGVEAYLNNYRWIRFIWQWTGYHPTIVEDTDFQELQEVVEMPSYPDDGSIQVINQTIVVKFS